MKKYILMSIAVVLYGLLTGASMAAGPDNFAMLVPGSHVVYNGPSSPPATTVGGFCYIPSTGRFYTSTYGQGRGIRVFVGTNEAFPVWPAPFAPENPLETAEGRSWHCDTDSDLVRVMGATSFENGTTILLDHRLNGFTVNPMPVTYNGRTYAAGELAVLNNNTSSGTTDVNKRLIVWDFREIWSPTNKQPDRDNAEYIPGVLETSQFGDVYGFGCTNWNDAFSSLMTFGQMCSAVGVWITPYVSDQVGGRRSTFSADGSKVYFVSMQSSTPKTFTGVWSVELATKTVRRLFDDTGSNVYIPDPNLMPNPAYPTFLPNPGYDPNDPNETDPEYLPNPNYDPQITDPLNPNHWEYQLNPAVPATIVDPNGANTLLGDLIKAKLKIIAASEPASVAIGTRNFTGQTGYANTVNQVLFNGTGMSGNIGGINVLVDDGSATPQIYAAMDGQHLFDLLGLGYIDFNDTANASVIANLPKVWSITADAQGNLYFYVNTPNTLYQYDTQGRLYCHATKAQQFAFNAFGMSSNSTNSTYLRAEARTVPNPYDANETIVQVMFMSSSAKCVVGVNVYKPCDFDRDGSVTLADLNFFKTQIQKTRAGTFPAALDDSEASNHYIRADINGDVVTGGTYAAGYTVNACVDEKDSKVLWQFVVPGDVNLNHTIDLQDLIALTENFCGTGKDWSQGDFDFDGTVDMDDFTLLSKHWLENYE